MQIYLQKKSKKRTVRIQIVLLFFILCLILTASTLIRTITHNNSTVEPNVLYTSISKGRFNQKNNNSDKTENISKKMNNNPEDYSFLHKNSGQNVKESINIPSDIRVLCSDGTIKVMDIEQYVLGCLYAEMPLSFEPQALMAQSVAIRSFTARKTLIQSSAHPGADVCTNYMCCQSYTQIKEKNVDSELFNKAKHAVSATKGIIVVFNGQPIEAVYHASSGYATKSSAEVWGGEISYLKSVKAPEGEAELTKKESVISYDKLSESLSGISEGIVKCGNFGENITVFEQENELCTSITVNGEEFSSKAIKNSLGLTSREFKIQKQKDSLLITCYGNGHGVGLSQHGANLLAKEGKSYAEILKYYYTGTGLAFISQDF